jgi:hypothetical protein
MDRQYFNPISNKVYTNKNGNSYICIAADGQCRAKFQGMTRHKWTFTAHGCQMYEDGTIEWNQSTGGYFAD